MRAPATDDRRGAVMGETSAAIGESASAGTIDSAITGADRLIARSGTAGAGSLYGATTATSAGDSSMGISSTLSMTSPSSSISTSEYSSGSAGGRLLAGFSAAFSTGAKNGAKTELSPGS